MKPMLRRIGKHVLSSLNRADEIGGEVRDYLQDKLENSPKGQKLLQRIRTLRGEKKTPAEEAEAAQKARSSARADAAKTAPPPTAAEISQDEQVGLSDKSIPAQIYGRNSCPWTGRSIRLLEDRKVDYDFIDLDEDEHADLVPALVEETRQNTVPYIYIRGQFVGGFNALNELDRLGELATLLLPEEERTDPPNATQVTVSPRPHSDETAPAE